MAGGGHLEAESLGGDVLAREEGLEVLGPGESVKRVELLLERDVRLLQQLNPLSDLRLKPRAPSDSSINPIRMADGCCQPVGSTTCA